jgi:hypothetical protein
MYETKNAIVLTRERLNGLEFESERLPISPNEGARSVLGPNRHPSTDGCCLELEIHGIQKRHAVQLRNRISRLQADAFREGVGFHRENSKRAAAQRHDVEGAKRYSWTAFSRS